MPEINFICSFATTNKQTQRKQSKTKTTTTKTMKAASWKMKKKLIQVSGVALNNKKKKNINNNGVFITFSCIKF